MKSVKFETVDDYIAHTSEKTARLLKQLRKCIRQSAPQAEECISYNIPAYRQGGPLVHFAAYPKHIGFYPGAQAIVDFKKEIAAYKSAKGSVQFPIDRPLPLKLVEKIVKFRVKQNAAKGAGLRGMKKAKPRSRRDAT